MSINQTSAEEERGAGHSRTIGAAAVEHRFEDRTMWEVFARRRFDEPLYHVGTVAADDPNLAGVYARTIFDEFTWVEMVLYPRSRSVRVVET